MKTNRQVVLCDGPTCNTFVPGIAVPADWITIKKGSLIPALTTTVTLDRDAHFCNVNCLVELTQA